MFGASSKSQKLAEPLQGPPPVNLPCKPTLLLGIPNFAITELSHVLINDLVYATTSRYSSPPDVASKLEVLQFLDGKSLLNLTQEFGGSVILSEDDVLDQTTGEVNMTKLENLGSQNYQAVVVDDTCFVREPAIRQFVQKQYHEKGVSVVVMGIEGIFDLSSLKQSFGVDWKIAAYTKRSIKVSEGGKRIIGDAAFPFDNRYIKAHFVVGQEELFVEYRCAEDYEDDSDYEDGPPAPNPGSPVVTSVTGNKSVSYFGFVNSLDVSYGAIILRLCYAAQHSNGEVGGKLEPTAARHIGKGEENLAEDEVQASFLEWYVALMVRQLGKILGNIKDKAD